MEKLNLRQWWGVLSEFVQVTNCSLFEGVQFAIDKYGEPVTEENRLQNFGANDGID